MRKTWHEKPDPVECQGPDIKDKQFIPYKLCHFHYERSLHGERVAEEFLRKSSGKPDLDPVLIWACVPIQNLTQIFSVHFSPTVYTSSVIFPKQMLLQFSYCRVYQEPMQYWAINLVCTLPIIRVHKKYNSSSSHSKISTFGPGQNNIAVQSKIPDRSSGSLCLWCNRDYYRFFPLLVYLNMNGGK